MADRDRATSFAVTRSMRRSSIQFGDLPTFDDVKKQEKFGFEHIVGAKFWFYFRQYLPFIAPAAFIAMFLVPLFLADNDDGFAFYGSLLSLASCGMVVLSYLNVLPWRRHPSSLMLQISITSIIISLVVVIQAFPSGKYWTHFNDGGLNLIGSDNYASDVNHSSPCQAMSFFVQLALMAREMWVFSLSMDLVTSITNPFASYRASVQKYHTVIWSLSFASAVVLVNQPSCQGQFMADGTCWIKISGTMSACFWGYFLAWVVAFYLFSVLAMLYAYMRISRGLESTYATRYACVADTFRVVFFYFGYCIVFYFFLSFTYIRPISDSKIRIVESIYAYFISCRGFFDALVWFFSHGFSNTNTNLGVGENRVVSAMVGVGGSMDSVASEVRDATQYAQMSHAQLRRQPTLTMADIVPPKPLRRSLYYTMRAACRCLTDLIGCSCGISMQSSKSPSADNTYQLDTDPESHHGAASSLLESEETDSDHGGLEGGRTSAARNRFNTRETEAMKMSDATISSRPSGSVLRSSQLSTGATTGQDRQFLSDVDLSPQLNFALRAELLYLVTMGIKESVLRLDQRDLHVLMSHHSSVAGDAPNSVSPGGVGDSPSTSRSHAGLSGSMSYSTQSQSYNFSPSYGAGRGAPHFTRPSTLRREVSSGTLSAGAQSPANSMKFPSMAGAAGAPSHAAAGALAGIAGPAVHGPHAHGHGHHGSYSFTASNAGSRIHYALNSIMCAVMGTHMPGEYGRDPLAATLIDDLSTHMRPSTLHLNHSPMHQTGRGSPLRQSMQQASHKVTSPQYEPAVDTPESKTPTAEPPTDLSYDQSALQEQLLTENVEIHQLQFTAPVPAPAEVIFNLNAKHQFRDFRPATFRKLRQMAGLEEDRYLELISQPTKERLSEGASGAFFFYCGEGELVVKTVAKHEAKTLLKILDRYLAYLQSRTESLLVRFLGLHSISMYGNEFNFVVMKNVFPQNVRMNDKYDIKGSWVNRHATRRDPGKRATCKYCNEFFVEGSSEKCPEVVGGHEAVVTLKDSDMINKIRLHPDHAYSLIDILNSDSDALCSMGMMDYSLLVGVKTMQYDIDSLQASQLAPPPDARLSSFSDAPGSQLDSTRRSTLSNPAPVDVSCVGARNRDKARLAAATDATRTTLDTTDNIPFDNRPSAVSEEECQESALESEIDRFITPGYPARAVVAPSTYYMGVIDVLQTWSWSKRLEHMFKVYILRQPAAGVSCVPPEEYKRRYQKKMAGIIEHSIFIREVTGSWRGKRYV